MPLIRLADEADIPALVELDTTAQHQPERAGDIAEWVLAGHCRVALEGYVPVGYLALTRSFFRSPFIEMLMVDAGRRRTGIGRALVADAIRSVGPARKLWTSTNASNAAMRALLGTLGFIESGVIENLDPGDPEIIFLRRP